MNQNTAATNRTVPQIQGAAAFSKPRPIVGKSNTDQMPSMQTYFVSR